MVRRRAPRVWVACLADDRRRGYDSVHTRLHRETHVSDNPPDSPKAAGDRRLLRFACAIWVLYGAVLAGCVLWDKERTTTRAYRQGADAWLNGRPLYDDNGRGFLYFPQSAIAFIPFAMLPHQAGEILWRWANLALLGVGLWKATRALAPSRAAKTFLGNSLLTLTLGWLALRSGQATAAMTGMMLLAAADLATARPRRAGFWLCTGLAVKPLTFVMWLLTAALIPGARKSLVCWSLALAAAQFLTQSPSYVLQQYSACPEMLLKAHDLGRLPEWPQFFAILQFCGLNCSSPCETGVRLVAALVALALCAAAIRKFDLPGAAECLFAASAIYLVLFNPRTEANTYILIAPAIGFALHRAMHSGRSWSVALCLLSSVLILGHYELGKHIQPVRPTILAPLGSLIFMLAELNDFRRRLDAARLAADGDPAAHGRRC